MRHDRPGAYNGVVPDPDTWEHGRMAPQKDGGPDYNPARDVTMRRDLCPRPHHRIMVDSAVIIHRGTVTDARVDRDQSEGANECPLAKHRPFRYDCSRVNHRLEASASFLYDG